jgi:hypothetical protein
MTKMTRKAAPTTILTARTRGALIRRSMRSGGVSTKLNMMASASGTRISRMK